MAPRRVPLAGAVTQEIIDILAVFNALRVAAPPRELADFPLPEAAARP